MRRLHPIRMAAVLAAFPSASSVAALSPLEGEQLFARRIQPMFEQKCLACHGRDEAKLKGGLDLRTRESAFEGGDSFQPAIVAGQPDESPMYLAVTRAHGDDWKPMPPKDNDALNAEQVAYIRDWIAAGAPWPEEARVKQLLAQPDKWSAADGVLVKTSGGLSEEWTQRRYKPENLWAYQPLRKPSVPPGSNAVDAFINARLAELKVAPAPAADRRTLIRRVTFDLTGLPPTPEEIAAFVADPSPDEPAFGRVVDRLLASPHYGEQWGRHWLDVARYADSSGLANDYARGTAWRYRDYVVRAFNADKPYADFVREQIAGDEIAPENPESVIAAGFLRMGPWELTAMEVPKVARQKFLDDVTDSVGQVFLAHPMQCARCHDHKFDPIPTRDYYSLQAIFATTQLAERPAAFLPAENTTGFEEKKYVDERDRYYRAILARLDQKSIAASRRWYKERNLDPAAFEAAVANEASRPRKAGGRENGFPAIRAAMMQSGTPEEKTPPKGIGFAPEDFGMERIARKGIERMRWAAERYDAVAFSVYDGRTPEVKAVTAPQKVPAARLTQGELEETAILAGGNAFSPGTKVTPAVLSAVTFLGGMAANPTAIPAGIAGRRTALADWIVSPQNPLTARVIVNRIWQWHFGTAIAGNPNNFGAMGKKPTHPELLDWLAVTFVEQGGSIKALHRLILNTAAYRRASSHPDPAAVAERDPNGISYAVFRPRRLDAEELRDAMLASSGELNGAVGGIPVRPEINLEAALQPRQVMGTFAEAWQPSPLPAQRHRRSLYVERIRGLRDPFMEVFNAPGSDLSCEARDASTVTPQVFALFNSQASFERAVALATRVRAETSGIELALARVFGLTLGRAPTPVELAQTRRHWEKMLARHRHLSFAAPTLPREVVRDAVEENTGERFSFREPLEASADFVPDIDVSAVPAETRALAEVCLVLFNTNEFAYVY